MEADATEVGETGECEADSTDVNVEQAVLMKSKESKDLSPAAEDDDGEIESDSSSNVSSEAADNPASPDAVQDSERSKQILLSRSGNKHCNVDKRQADKDQACAAAERQAIDGTAGFGCASNHDDEEGYFDDDDDDRSQTPLQDEPDAVSELDQRDDDNESDIDNEIQPSGVRGENQCSSISVSHKVKVISAASDEAADGDEQGSDNQVRAKGSSDICRKHSVRDDVGELDYEEEENQDELAGDSAANSSGEDGADVKVNKKPVKKDSKKREKATKEDDSEKEEGEALEEGEQEEGEHSTDGELDDDDDCEEGEIKEPGQKKPFVRPICRFFMRGNCTWGHSCRFLHPGINDKGSYALIDQAPFPMPGPPPPGMMVVPMVGPGGRGPLPPPPGPWLHEVPPRRIPRGPVDVGPPMIEPDHPPPSSGGVESSSESAWERGLRHAKEIRKKRKENEPGFEDKKDGSPKEERISSPLPPPAREIAAHLPPPREAFFEEPPLPVPPVFEEDFYGRPVLPPPPEAWSYRPPFDPYDPRWARGPPLEYPPPPHIMPPMPEFRIPERDRGHRFSPPPRFDTRRDHRFNPYFDRFPPDGSGREPGLHAAGGDVPVPALRGRGEEWKDPWLRSRSPKRKRNSSSRSASRGRRRYRSRSRGSYSSVSSSSYSSNSRSRSGSSSSYSSYSKSSYSRSSYSSRSSSISRSRSPSGRKPLPATTLGQSLLEKRKIHSEIHRPPASNTTEPLAIGSGPLPARAPPEKKPPAVALQSQSKPTAPRPVVAPAVQEMSKPATNAASLSAGGQTQSTKPGHTSSVPKLSLPLSSRSTLQPVGRGVAAAFTDQEDAWSDSNDHFGSKSVEASNARPPSPPSVTELQRKANMTPPLERSASGRDRSAAYSRTTSVPGEHDKGSLSQRDLPGSRSNAASSSVPGDRGRPDSKTLPSRDYDVSGRQPSDKSRLLIGHNLPASDKELAASGRSTSNRSGEAKDQYGRPKVESGKTIRPRSTSSRSPSAESQRSLSSLSSSSSEHLYDDIASPISSNSSLSSIDSPNKKAASKPKRPPSPRKAQPRTPPPPSSSSHPAASHRVEKSREPAARVPPRDALPSREERHEGQRELYRETAPSSHRPPSHRPDIQRQVSSRGMPAEPPRDAARDVRRDPINVRERDRGQYVPSTQAAHGSSSLMHREGGSRRPPTSGVPAGRSSGARVPDDTRLKIAAATSSGSRNAIPPPPRPSEGSLSSRTLESRGGGGGSSDPRITNSSIKSDVKTIAKSDRSAPPPHSSSSASANRKRAAEQGSEMPNAKHMRHASDVRSPVKIPIPPRKDKPGAVSPSRGGGRLETSRSSAMSASGSGRSPAKATVPMPPSKPSTLPSSSASHSGNSAAKPRKSTSSRREELLMQLKAVEDAIAKKRSKLQ